jgi:hypothetical protein
LTSLFQKTSIITTKKQTVQFGDALENTAFKLVLGMVKYYTLLSLSSLLPCEIDTTNVFLIWRPFRYLFFQLFIPGLTPVSLLEAYWQGLKISHNLQTPRKTTIFTSRIVYALGFRESQKTKVAF